MAIVERVGTLLSRAFSKMLSRPDDPYRLIQMLPVPLLPAGIHITMENALQLSAVWGCIDVISKSLAACHWSVYTQDSNNRRTALPEDPLDYKLNTRPNPDMPAIAFKQGMIISALSWGNGYAEIVPDGAGRVAQLWPLFPDRVTPRRDPKTWEIYYEYEQPDGGKVAIPAARMYHLRGPGIYGLMGDNFIARMAKSIALNAAAERFSSTYFGNNTILGGVLEYPKTLDDRTYERLKQSWEDRYKGPDKAHRPAILEGGMKWVPLEADASKAQMIEARKFQLEEIARWFGVPLHKLQHIDRATFNNIEHLGIEFVRDALTPWALRLEQEADYKLFSARGPRRFTKLDMAWLLYGDAKSRAEYYQIMRRIGAYSVNEIRAKEGDNSIGAEGDIRIVEKNMITLGQLELEEERAELSVETMRKGGVGLGAKEPIEDAELDEGEGDEGKTPSPGADALVRDATITLFASTLDRYVRRLRARESDLVKSGVRNGKVSANLVQERERLKTSWLVPECENALTLVEKVGGSTQGKDVVGILCTAAEAVDNGEDPRAAAARVVSILMPAATTRKELLS